MRKGESCGRSATTALLAASFLLTSIVVRADAFDYLCSNCVAPGCICASIEPPGGLSPADTPQIVLLTFDDAINSNSYPLHQQILTNHWNPNGTPIQVTFYAESDWCDFRLVQLHYAHGHEIAVHTISHDTTTNTDIQTWRNEILGCRKLFSELAQIPLEDIVGFRAPNLAYCHNSFQVLAEAGMEYDASVTERPGWLSPDGSNSIWPYTLDCGFAQRAEFGTAPDTPFPGLFEVPMWMLLNGEGEELGSMDPEGSREEVLALLQLNFSNHYTGNRAPLGIFLHQYWLEEESWRISMINDFITWAQSHPDVWFVTTRALVRYMRNPVGAANAATFPPFITATRTPSPEESVISCVYTDGTFRSCADCPTVFPWPDTVFTKGSPSTGGVAWVEVTSQWSDSFEGLLWVSNSSSRTIVQWSAEFELGSGNMDEVWDGTCETNGARYIFHPLDADRKLEPGDRRRIAFNVKNTGGTVQINNLAATCTELVPVAPLIGNVIGDAQNRVALNWNNVAASYELEFTTNRDLIGWQPLAEVHGRTSSVVTLPPDWEGCFLRLRVLP